MTAAELIIYLQLLPSDIVICHGSDNAVYGPVRHPVLVTVAQEPDGHVYTQILGQPYIGRLPATQVALLTTHLC
jgi:hypothetical protein